MLLVVGSGGLKSGSRKPEVHAPQRANGHKYQMATSRVGCWIRPPRIPPRHGRWEADIWCYWLLDCRGRIYIASAPEEGAGPRGLPAAMQWGGVCWCWLGKAADWIRASGCWLGDGVKIRHKAAAAAAAAAAAPRTQRIGRWGLTREPRLRFTSCGRTHHSPRRSERSQGLQHSGGGSLPVGMSTQAPCCLLPVGPVAWCMLLLLLPVGCFPLSILAWGVLYATPSLSPSLSVYINK
jgi:hypothetical protein